MKAVVALTKQEYDIYTQMYSNLKRDISIIKGDALTKSGSVNKNVVFDNYTYKPGYAHYEFSGKIKEEFKGTITTPEQIIMLVDGGFSHFGASCTIDRNTLEFKGRVNTD